MANTLTIRLDGELVKVMPFILAPDYNNVIAKNPSSPYTCTQDCYLGGSLHVYYTGSDGTYNVSVNGSKVIGGYTGYDHNESIPLTQLPKGSVVTVSGAGVIYGSSNLCIYSVTSN